MNAADNARKSTVRCLCLTGGRIVRNPAEYICSFLLLPNMRTFAKNSSNVKPRDANNAETRNPVVGRKGRCAGKRNEVESQLS